MRASPLLPLAALVCCVGLSSCLSHVERMERRAGDPQSVEYNNPYPDNIAGFDYWVGARDMEVDAWAPLDTPASMGFHYRSYLNLEPLEFELGGSYAYERQGGGSDPLSRLRFYEVDLGLGLSANPNSGRYFIEPYVGAGLTWLIGRSDLEQGGGIDTFDDTDFGTYVHGGVRLYVQDRQYVFADWRRTFGTELDVGFGTLDATYEMFSVGLGVSF